MDYKRLEKRIRKERLRLNLTQAQLAEPIDISDTYMGAIERGARSLTLDTLVRLVNRLGVTVDYMLADSVTDNDSNIMEQLKQIIDNQPLERKQMASMYSAPSFLTLTQTADCGQFTLIFTCPQVPHKIYIIQQSPGGYPIPQSLL